MTDKKVRRKFTNDFKKEAVALVTEEGYTFSQAAEAISINEGYLRRWKKELDAENKPGSLSQLERDELSRLRRDNNQLRMEKDILKKGSAFFARAMN